jgi:hypothetical protein
VGTARAPGAARIEEETHVSCSFAETEDEEPMAVAVSSMETGLGAA